MAFTNKFQSAFKGCCHHLYQVLTRECVNHSVPFHPATCSPHLIHPRPLSLAYPHHCEQGRKTENQFPSVAPINKLWRFSVLSKMRFATNLIYLNCSCPPRIKTPSEHISLGLVRSLMHWKYPDFSLMEKTCTESGELRL